MLIWFRRFFSRSFWFFLGSYLTFCYVGLQFDSMPFWSREGDLWSLRLTLPMQVACVGFVGSFCGWVISLILIYGVGKKC